MGRFKKDRDLVKLKQVLKRWQHANNKNINNSTFKYKNFTFLKGKNTHNTGKTSKPLYIWLLRYSVLLVSLISTPLSITYFLLHTQLHSQVEYELLIINFLSNSSFENFCIDLGVIW